MPPNHYLDDHQFYSPPRRPSHQATSSGTQPQHSISPWSPSSYSADPNFLTLPPLLGTFEEEEPSIFQPIRLERSTSNSLSLAQPRSVPLSQNSSTPLQTRLQVDAYDLSDSPDLFINFEGDPHMSTPPTGNTRASSVVDLTSSSPGEMAPSRKRKIPSADESQARHKRQRAEPRDDSDFRQAVRPPSNSPRPQIEEVDITGIDNDQQYEDFKKKQQEDLIKQQNQERADKPVRLADFQCIICLDNPTDLTVTHCGHLFCSLCLHEALHTGTQKSNCPVCRTVISTAKKSGRHGDSTLKQPKNGVYALEMKLMTARRKEKLPAAIR